MTDGQGRTVDFRNTLLIMTSNIGAEYLLNLPEDADSQAARGPVMDSVQATFRPEFLNRLDEILLFRRLGPEHLEKIVEIQLKYLDERLRGLELGLDVDPAGKRWLAERGYNPSFGARPLQRVIRTEVENRLASLLLEGEIPPGGIVRIGVKDGSLSLEAARPEA